MRLLSKSCDKSEKSRVAISDRQQMKALYTEYEEKSFVIIVLNSVERDNAFVCIWEVRQDPAYPQMAKTCFKKLCSLSGNMFKLTDEKEFEAIVDDILDELRQAGAENEQTRQTIIKNGCPHESKVERVGRFSKEHYLECPVCNKQFDINTGEEIK